MVSWARTRDIRGKREEGRQGQDRLWSVWKALYSPSEGVDTQQEKAEAQVWGSST